MLQALVFPSTPVVKADTCAQGHLTIAHAKHNCDIAESTPCPVQDMAELEAAVGQNLFPVEQLGAPFRVVRAFRPLLFLETAAVRDSPLRKELPPSVVLHHLYSRAPAELQSPHARNGLSPAQVGVGHDCISVCIWPCNNLTFQLQCNHAICYGYATLQSLH